MVVSKEQERILFPVCIKIDVLYSNTKINVRIKQTNKQTKKNHDYPL